MKPVSLDKRTPIDGMHRTHLEETCPRALAVGGDGALGFLAGRHFDIFLEGDIRRGILEHSI